MRATHQLRLGAAAFAAGMLVAASPVSGQTEVWVGGGPDTSYTTPANWVGGIVPSNSGTDTVQLNSTAFDNIQFNSPQSVAGMVLQSINGYYSYYDLYQGGSGSLAIGSGGMSYIATPGFVLYAGIPITLSASQTWDPGSGYVYSSVGIGETTPSSLTINGTAYMAGTNTFSGGLTVTSTGTLQAATDSAAGLGTLTLLDNASVYAWYQTVNLSNPVSLGNYVTIGADYVGNSLTLSGAITAQAADTTLLVASNSSVFLAGTVSGPPGTTLVISGAGAQLPSDGGSRLVIEGDLNQVTSLTVDNAAVILAPTDTAANTTGSLNATASLLSTGVSVVNQGYLGLDGGFTTPLAVQSFLSTYGGFLGANIDGTLGFDTVGNPASPNHFSDPIDLTKFTSLSFLGLGSATTAIIDGQITPGVIGEGTNASYVFGGGGGTLTVTGTLNDFAGSYLVMTPAPEPLTLILHGSNNYTLGTVSEGGVLIFDSPPPATGMITLAGGYVGSTENANFSSSQQWVSLFATYSASGVIGFDSTNPALPRIVIDAIDLSGFSGESVPFLGTATVVTLSGTITPPADGQYQFAGVKGGRLTVSSDLAQADSTLTVGLLAPIENQGTISTVTLTGDNSAVIAMTFNSGALFINNNNALGSGPIMVPDAATTPVAPYLAPFGVMVSPSNYLSVTVSLSNDLSVGAIGSGYNATPGITLGNYSTSDMLVLTGVISDYPSQSGLIAIDGLVTLKGANTYSGGTNITGEGNALVLVNNSMALGTGPVTVQSPGTLAATGGDVALNNSFALESTLSLGQVGNINTLTLNGAVSGYGSLEILSNVALMVANSYSGGTFVTNATVTVGDPNALGSGEVNLSSSIIDEQLLAPTITDLNGDSGSSVQLMPNAVLTLNTDQNLQQPVVFWGSIVGDGTDQVVKTGAGVEYLGGSSSFGGGTSVNSGVLIAGNSNALGTGPVSVAGGAGLGIDTGVTLSNSLTLSPGSGLGGLGTFSPPGGVTFAGGTQVTPGVNGLSGEYIGTLAFGTPVTFGTGGIYKFDVQDASGAAGTGYDTLDITASTLTLSATSSSPFTISLQSIDPGTGLPGMANFNPAQSYSWTLLSAGSIYGTFSSADFAVTTNGFQNPTGGGDFWVGETGNSLTLNFTPVPEPSTWALMMAGLAAVGVGLRRRRRA